MVEIALVLPPEPDERWRLAAQMGVTKAVIHPLEIGDDTRFWEYDRLLMLKNWLEDAGLEFSVIEGSVPITDETRLGLDGRDEEIETFKQFLWDLGDLGVPTVCYDWMASVRWARTASHVPLRGGSLTTSFDETKMRGGPPPAATNVTHEELWDNLAYFLEEVVPVARAAQGHAASAA